MNRAAVEKLLEHLKEQQKTKAAARFNMKFFGVSSNNSMIEEMLEVPECNTQACLAGETILANNLGYIPKEGGILLNNGQAYGHDIEWAATVALDLSDAEADRLFFFREWTDNERDGWPEQFEDAYRLAYTPANRLQVAIDRVQHFLDTEGWE